MLGMQSAGGERRAKRGVSRLAVPHIYFSIKTCFAAPLLGDKGSAAYNPSLCCTPPEIELLLAPNLDKQRTQVLRGGIRTLVTLTD